MPGSPSPNKGYIIPTVFGDLNIWGNELNTNFTNIDLNLGGTLSVALSGSTAAVSGSNINYGGYKFTGTLTGTNTISFSSYAGFAFFYNNTAGSQNISCGISGGTYITVTPGESIIAWSDGTNFYRTAIVGGGGSTTGSGPVVLASGATVSNMNGVIPPGTINQYAGSTSPNSAQWLMCDGTAYSRTTYAALFAACGTAYGAGNGTTTFNVPDMRGRTGVGFDSGNATGRMTNAAGFGMSAAAVGNNGGEQYHTLSGNELAVHAHGVADPTHAHGVADPTHAHGVADPSHVHGVGDPGHAHGVADPGHVHGLDGAIYCNEPGGGVYAQVNGSNYFNQINQNSGAQTGGSGVGIGIYGSGTGVYLGYSGTGIGIYGAYTGIGIYGAYTGISIGNAGANYGHNNTQPGLVTGYMIHT